MKLSEMRQVLAAREIQLTRSLGQNFLHDANQLRRIVSAAELNADDQVLEIGPGLGPLTEKLIEAAGSVLAIEKDRRLHEFLQERFAGERKLTLLHADALDYLQQEARDWSGWKLVANLPYSVASPILVELAQARRAPERLVATLQREVVQRLSASAGSGDYGLLSLLVQVVYEPRGWFRIPPSCFFPPPDIDSACITLVRRSQPLLGSAEAGVFVRLVKRGFSQRRKMLLKLLREEWPAALLPEFFHQLKIAESARAEAVSLEQFVELAKLMRGQTEPEP